MVQNVLENIKFNKREAPSNFFRLSIFMRDLSNMQEFEERLNFFSQIIPERIEISMKYEVWRLKFLL